MLPPLGTVTLILLAARDFLKKLALIMTTAFRALCKNRHFSDSAVKRKSFKAWEKTGRVAISASYIFSHFKTKILNKIGSSGDLPGYTIYLRFKAKR